MKEDYVFENQKNKELLYLLKPKMMELHTYISERWSPREFSPNEISQDQIDLLFEAARWAASARNSQPWRFVYASKNNVDQWNMLFSCLTESNQKWVETAPLLILTMVKKYDSISEAKLKFAWHDLGLAIGNLTFQAMSMQLFVHNMGGFSADRAIELLRIPNNFEPVTMIAVGEIDKSKTSRPEAIRRDLKTLVFQNDWQKME